jgi:LPXTG-motif cell wall-anchored protein
MLFFKFFRLKIQIKIVRRSICTRDTATRTARTTTNTTPLQPQIPEQPKVTEKPVIPQLEKPQQIVIKPQLEQTPKKIETYLPTTGGKAENPYIKWIGLACVVLGLIGAVFAVRNRKKAQS